MIEANKFRLVWLIVFLCFPAFTARAQNAETVALNADAMRDGKTFSLNKLPWKYQAGDNAAWASPAFDDRDWKRLTNDEINFDPAGALEKWNGQAWFRLKLNVDESLVNQPLALRFWHWGASEIYLDGERLENFGTVAGSVENANQSGELELNPRGFPVAFVFKTGGEHTLAVRYSLTEVNDLSSVFGKWMAHGRFGPGFTGGIQNAGSAIISYSNNLLGYSGNKLFIGILYSFALLHFLLFIFYRQQRANLFYSLFAFCLANATLANNIVNANRLTAIVSAISFIVFAFSYGAAFAALQAFLYEAFAPRFSKFFRFTGVLLAVQLIIVCIVIRDRISLYVTCVLMVILLADCLRLIVAAMRERRDGAWIIAGGVSILAVGILMAIGREFQIEIKSQWYSDFGDIALYVGLPIAVSIYLARNFARTNRNLQTQLLQVREYAEKQVEHERKEARLAIVEAENRRQAKELEEARQLQLSMLPKKLPKIAGLEIAAYMKPATEVGGDYYDFHIGSDGTLTVAVGDATGHGLKAGTVVTATKSLFNNLAAAPDIPDTLRQISRSLKAMNLRGLFMAMTLIKFKDNSLSICAAGMPSTIIYRHAEKTVEEISIRALPLGGMTNSKYQPQEISLKTGDVVMVMSDGFPEMFNPSGEMLGFEKGAEVLKEIADHAPQEIIDRFVEVSSNWSAERPADDDVTFVVMKIL